MSLFSLSLLVRCAGSLLLVAPTEPTPPTDPASAGPAEPPPAAAPAIPSPSAIRPELLQPAGLGPTPTRPAPAPTLAVTPKAPARPESRRSRLPRGWALDLSGGTSFPISVGAGLQLEAPIRLLAQLDAGVMPGAYVDVLDALAARTRSSPPGGDLARDASRRSFVVRAALGLRPLKRLGLEVRGGYTLHTFGEMVTTPATLGMLAGTDLVGDAPLPLRATIHNIHADVGWRWIVRGNVLVRAALGYIQSLGARLLPTPDTTAAPEELEQQGDTLSALEEEAATTALRAPTLTVNVGYRF